MKKVKLKFDKFKKECQYYRFHGVEKRGRALHECCHPTWLNLKNNGKLLGFGEEIIYICHRFECPLY